MIYIGIDPGTKGGMAISFDGRTIGCCESLSMDELDHLIDELDSYLVNEHISIVLESIPKFTGRIIPGSSALVLGRSWGLLEGIARGMKIPVIDVTPKVWQAPIPGLKNLTGAPRKRALRNYAHKRHPHLKPTLATADAILILDFYLNNNNNKRK